MQLTHLKYLHAVCKYGSMNRAAKELFVSQPTLSKAIQTLEKEIGGPLLNRNSSGIELTYLGKVVLQDIQSILAYVDNWNLIASSESQYTPITIFISGSAPRFDFVHSIVNIRKLHPELDIRVSYTVAGANRFPDSIPSPRIVIQYNVPSDIDTALEYAKSHNFELAIIQHDEFALFINSNHELAKSGNITIDMLNNCNIMVHQDPMGFPYSDILVDANCNAKIQMWEEDILMLNLMLDESVLSLRPLNTALHNPYIDSGSIQTRKISGCSMPVHLCSYYPNSDRINLSEQIFINSIKESFPEFIVVQ